jgi:hypothetical protein
MNFAIFGINHYCKQCGYGARLKRVFDKNHPSEHARWYKATHQKPRPAEKKEE